MREIRAVLGIYELSINGNTAMSKLLRALVTPTVNRQVETLAEWTRNVKPDAPAAQPPLAADATARR